MDVDGQAVKDTQRRLLNRFVYFHFFGLLSEPPYRVSSDYLHTTKQHPTKGAVLWWAEVDSNHRSRRRQIYSLIHLAALESAHI